ncbi:hypothetical protein GALMADRAFT_161355 [Galerina marginata CBS 339.88]|uniref:ADP-ribosylation factor n=1 Tax=Galerina marginata (strain CBS 339.88) TaxID=685588 RepID=A0A067SA81_GALM3|nr:hypothetical protein GALMADRAFT_161355 [Galerina marginata CBS 339.88]
MSSIIRRLLSRLYTNTQGDRIMITGLDYGGKTTLLYLLKLGEIVQTTPGLGFNIETISITTASGKPFRMTGLDVGSGCGGIQYMHGLIGMYISNNEGVIWVVDASDKERLSESVEMLQKVLSSAESEDISSKSKPILILANKSDIPNAMGLDYIRVNFAKATSGRLAGVFKTSLTENTVVGTGLPEAFDWLQLALEIAKSRKDGSVSNASEPQIPNPRSQSVLTQKLESWLARVETDVQADEFLEKFQTFSLPDWDHYTHIRIAYVILTKYGRKEGKDMIFQGLEKYIAVSPQTKGRSFHVSMTYFWIQIVHFGIRNMPPSPDSASTSPAPTSESALASPDDFGRFLLMNPHVADGNLWSDYYTKDVLMSPKAKGEMVLPDKKPLPNLVARDAITTLGAQAR